LHQSYPVTALLLGAVRPVAPDPKTRQALLARLAAQPGSAAASPLRERVLGEDTRGAPPNSLVLKRASEASWESTAVAGVTIRTLFVDDANNHFTALVRMAPGTSYPRHIHSGPEECLVLEGDLRVGEDVIMHVGDYQRAPTGSCHGVQSTEQGCLLLITSSLTDQFV
jgi:anti-sigma factor ChrR (cupin superfamily)